ncbi:HD domain-containing phosphohydrolase [[Clostridium] polysaccharolyticum]|uniref:HDIG domain-containing protein n=1 Tax=[Clostridium] polysaccharolyticum TaxID=29364 RepID=A0A1H9Y673_9FIRM|nr:HD domain-containing phosphohydrolase [[Clostridium] polysaccharolyticum]SES64235.1 HDIG domain-containing protein [[Clostridium] polysaccharolyticum]
MGVIKNQDIYLVMHRSLSMVDKEITEHGKEVGYILYKMLVSQNKYFLQELIDYTTIGVLHDIGLYKSPDQETIHREETKNVWKHSIYGFLFLKYFSPLGNKAEIVLYHHLDYSKYQLINSAHIEVAEYLAFADKLDTFMRSSNEDRDAEFFAKQSGVRFSERAKQVFLNAEKKYQIFENIRTGAYEEELAALLRKKLTSEEQKRNFLEMLIYTIDFRSEHTVVHSLATTTFAVEIAKLMHLPAADIYNIYYGALLHDIGKLVTPVEILESPRRLNEDEMRIMQEHVVNSEKILRGTIDDTVLEIAIRHHEKLDGSGYHRGLKGEDLTIPQRIVAVADIISALYGKRSYKDSFDIERIKEILMADSDAGKLCPEVVGYAVRNMKWLVRNFEKKKEKTIGNYILIKEQYEEIYNKFKQFELEEEGQNEVPIKY